MEALQFAAIGQVALVDIEIPNPGPHEVLIHTGAMTAEATAMPLFNVLRETRN